ncbi:MAG: alpha-amylase family glycosyl hydrolase [Spirochaetota bacterium]
MNDHIWHQTVHSDTLPPFLVPEEPALGDELEVRLRVARDAPVAKVYVRAIIDGIDHHIPAELERRGERFAWYRGRFDLRQPSTRYHFLVRTTGGSTRYYTRAGVTGVFPTEDHDFTVNTAYRAPEWVRRSVFYQIFPDRFHGGDRSLGVRDGEITRGEFSSREMDWTDDPLPYPEGGSLDFFNGDLPGIEAKLDYLVGLGVSAIYLTPVFTANTNHRYDCLDYFSVDPHLGGDEALASLVAAAHARDMKVVLDVSINHVGVEHPWADGMVVDGRTVDVIQRDGGAVVHWAGVPDLLKLDYEVAELRDRIYRDPDSVVQRYLKPPFNVDGWRFDVASETGRYAGRQEQGHQIWREIRSVVRAINPQAYILGEHWHQSNDYLQGDQWDSAMNYFASGRLLRMWLGEQDRFADPGAPEATPGRRITGGELRRLLEQHFASIPSGVVHTQFNLIDSHDVTRLHTNEAVFDWDLYAGAIMLLAFLPGTFSIYYGDEIGISGTLDGDHGKRYPMRWSPREWDERFVDLYGTMARVKQEREALQRGSFRVLDTGDDYLVAARFTTGEALVLVLNRREQRSEFVVDTAILGLREADALTRAQSVELDGDTLRLTLDARVSALVAGSTAES